VAVDISLENNVRLWEIFLFLRLNKKQQIMKKLFTTLFFSMALAVGYEAQAQYCGSSQISSCGLPSSTYGFGDLNSYPCITRGQNDSIVFKFKTYNSFTVGASSVTIYKLMIDSMENLPCGLCWSTNKPTNEFLPDEDGCIIIKGLTHDRAGQYKIRLILDVNTNNGTTYNIHGINADAGGVFVYMRVKDAGGACDTVKTSSPSNTKDCTFTGIEEIANAVSTISIQPNPVANEAKVSFYATQSGEQQLRVINIVGGEVLKMNLSAKQGMNETTINRNNMPAGVYFLSIGSGQGTVTRKFIVSE
jgi:hypothetical protein